MKDAVTQLHFQGNHGESKAFNQQNMRAWQLLMNIVPWQKGNITRAAHIRGGRQNVSQVALQDSGRHSVCKLGRELRSLLRCRAHRSEVYHELCHPSLVSLLARAVFGFIPSVQAVTVFPVTLITVFSCSQRYTSFTYLLPLPSG